MSTRTNDNLASAERWHGEVDALQDALLATVLEQEGVHAGLAPEQVLEALAGLVALVVVSQPRRRRLGLLARLKATVGEHVNAEIGHEPVEGVEWN